MEWTNKQRDIMKSLIRFPSEKNIPFQPADRWCTSWVGIDFFKAGLSRPGLSFGYLQCCTDQVKLTRHRRRSNLFNKNSVPQGIKNFIEITRWPQLCSENWLIVTWEGPMPLFIRIGDSQGRAWLGASECFSLDANSLECRFWTMVRSNVPIWLQTSPLAFPASADHYYNSWG